MIRFSVGAMSDAGKVRTLNEDCAFVSERAVAVADGMGGHEGGEVASLVAIQALLDAINDPEIETLTDAVASANTAVWERSIKDNMRGMGTTLCTLALAQRSEAGETETSPGQGVVLAAVNVGDSRIYRLSDGELEQVSRDHSLVEDLLRDGQITFEEAESHPQRNVITKVLGIGPVIEVDWWELPPTVGDRYLLCSDGLHGEVNDAKIAATLRRIADPQEAAYELVSQANLAGGRDNVTVLVVDLVEGKAPDAPRYEGRVVQPDIPDLAGFYAMPAGSRPSAMGPVADGLSDEVAQRSMLAPEEEQPSRRPRLVTMRTVVFLLSILAVFIFAAGAVVWYAGNGYFIDTDADGEVVIYQGRPGGLLWFDPTLAESTDLALDELTPILREQIEATPSFGTLSEAKAYLANIEDQLSRSGGRTSLNRQDNQNTEGQ